MLGAAPPLNCPCTWLAAPMHERSPVQAQVHARPGSAKKSNLQPGSMFPSNPLQGSRYVANLNVKWALANNRTRCSMPGPHEANKAPAEPRSSWSEPSQHEERSAAAAPAVAAPTAAAPSGMAEVGLSPPLCTSKGAHDTAHLIRWQFRGSKALAGMQVPEPCPAQDCWAEEEEEEEQQVTYKASQRQQYGGAPVPGRSLGQASAALRYGASQASLCKSGRAPEGSTLSLHAC